MISRPVALGLAAAVVALTLSACSNDSATSSVKITATDSACKVSSTKLATGSTSFKITNAGTKVTEVYIYAKGDRIVGEAENIGPGLSRTLKVSLANGTYEVACKPGQTGNGLRETLAVS